MAAILVATLELGFLSIRLATDKGRKTLELLADRAGWQITRVLAHQTVLG